MQESYGYDSPGGAMRQRRQNNGAPSQYGGQRNEVMGSAQRGANGMTANSYMGQVRQSQSPGNDMPGNRGYGGYQGEQSPYGQYGGGGYQQSPQRQPYVGYGGYQQPRQQYGGGYGFQRPRQQQWGGGYFGGYQQPQQAWGMGYQNPPGPYMGAVGGTSGFGIRGAQGDQQLQARDAYLKLRNWGRENVPVDPNAQIGQ